MNSAMNFYFEIQQLCELSKKNQTVVLQIIRKAETAIGISYALRQFARAWVIRDFFKQIIYNAAYIPDASTTSTKSRARDLNQNKHKQLILFAYVIKALF